MSDLPPGILPFHNPERDSTRQRLRHARHLVRRMNAELATRWQELQAEAHSASVVEIEQFADALATYHDVVERLRRFAEDEERRDEQRRRARRLN